MALHCPATLLVGLPGTVDRLDEPGLVTGYGPYAGHEVDVVEELLLALAGIKLYTGLGAARPEEVSL